MRFHVPGLAHTVSHPDYSSCAFTQKVVKLCAMLKMEGHTVIHYGHKDSKVDCDEHVTVTRDKDLFRSYGPWDWRKKGFPPHFKIDDECYRTFNFQTPIQIKLRQQPGDMLLCSFGDWHRPIAQLLPDMPAIESGIGYPNGSFAKYRIFESYAIMHAYQGTQAAMQSSESRWYDSVIPNAFDPHDFIYQDNKQDYFAFVGRLGSHKGLHIAIDIAERTQTKLLVAGQGELPRASKWVSHLGVLGPNDRAGLLAQAKATICASTFLEPFCGVQIESMMSGTPVISSDWGAFAEYNIHGETGYRCKTMDHFLFAARNVDKIKSLACRQWAEKFSLSNVAPRYTEYLQSVKDIHGDAGWYELHDDRESLANTSNPAF